MPLDQQKTLVDAIRSEIDRRPPGVEARVAGLPVLAADANAELSDSRYLLTGAGPLGGGPGPARSSTARSGAP